MQRGDEDQSCKGKMVLSLGLKEGVTETGTWIPIQIDVIVCFMISFWTQIDSQSKNAEI